MNQVIAKKINKTETGHFLYASGLLFEINRSILHPVGQSLRWSETEGLGLLDYSEMPERAVFDPIDYAKGSAKFKNFMRSKGDSIMRLRKQILGFVTQGDNIGKNQNR